MHHIVKKQWRKILIGIIALGIFVGVANGYILLRNNDRIFNDASKVPEKRVAIVLGAGIKKDGKMTDMLSDRVKTGLLLYRDGRVKKILVTGDHGQKKRDEVTPMKDFFVRSGVPEKDITVDQAGFDTYDSLYRAKHVFGVSQAVIVTQRFHLPRALYLAKALDLDAVGFTADRQKYRQIVYFRFREIFARVKAVYNVFFNSGPEVFGKP